MDTMFGQPPAVALWFLLPALPICLWATWSDLATMKIPNRAVLALVAVFAVVGLIVLPLPDYGWRWVGLAVVLVAGFVLSSLGLLGAGDAKFAAAMAPFVAPTDAGRFLMLLAAVTVAAFLLHRTARAMPVVRERTAHWVSWTRGRQFPMGLALGPALAFYLALAAAGV
ncbi:MAG: prepilin peptidase [Rhodobacteraceae bacterium]|jgi:prepilin peptidase CpaA|nr:prepilin peptidase [Paracoccaceae bacterium]